MEADVAGQRRRLRSPAKDISRRLMTEIQLEYVSEKRDVQTLETLSEFDAA